MTKDNNFETDTKYLKILDDIQDIVLNIYKNSDRSDLIMLYEIKEKKIYSYIYSEFLTGLNLKSQSILKKQYTSASKKDKVVLFIRDEENEIFKSYTI